MDMKKNIYLIFIIIFSGLFSCISTGKPAYIPDCPNKTDSDGNKHGVWIFYYNDKYLKVAGWQDAHYYRIIEYENGKPAGLVRTYYISGEIRQECSLLNDDPDIPDGLNSWYYKNGKKSAQGVYKKGKKHGRFLWWYESGTKKTEGYYKEDYESGFWVYFYENGNKKKQGDFVDGKPAGSWTYWHENGEKKGEEYYESGKLEGKLLRWYENGLKKIEAQYKTGALDGLSTWFYDNGKKKIESNYTTGIQEGSCVWWYENGQKKTEGFYTGGKEDGFWSFWYENGNKKQTGEYTKGVKTGLWTYWYENGNNKAKISKTELCIVWDVDRQLKFYGTYEEFKHKATELAKVNKEIKTLVDEYANID